MHVLLYVRNDVPSNRVWDIRFFRYQIINIMGLIKDVGVVKEIQMFNRNLLKVPS